LISQDYKTIHFAQFVIYFNIFSKSFGIPYYVNAIDTTCILFWVS